MNFENFLIRLSQHYEKQLPFALFSQPDQNEVKAYLQETSELHLNNKLNQDGFVMAPFNPQEETVCIPASESTTLTAVFEKETFPFHRVEIEETEQDEETHKKLVDRTIAFIKEGHSKKIVISRRKKIQLHDFSIRELIAQILKVHPLAYRYLWYHPQTGIWCGATPETLVSVKENNFKTMALAGTQPYKTGEITWRKKERDEQHFVTEAIVEDLKPYVEDVQVGELETIRAGSLLHLKSDILGKMKDTPGTLSKIISKMHPTPAVCGTPQDISLDFIVKEEADSREFYTGYVGIMEDQAQSAQFMVNLRSMKIDNGMVTIYIGGGITADSDATEEWTETHNKMQTMLQVLKPML